MSPATRILVASLWMGLAGCVPVLPHSYFRPTASAGSSPRNPCWRTYENLVVPLGAGEATIRIVEPGGGRAFVMVVLQVPRGHRARVERADFEMTDASGAQRRLVFDGVGNNEIIDGTRLSIDRDLDGVTDRPSPSNGRNYWLYAPLDAHPPADFTVLLPAIAFDDVTRVLPLVRFTRTTDLQWVAPLQC